VDVNRALSNMPRSEDNTYVLELSRLDCRWMR
jgi:hypothetical protein